MTPLVSIALCTYNGEQYLIEQLDTIVHQDYKNLEIVIVDDCSKDNTFALLEKYATDYPFIKLHKNKENLGYIKNFEKVISLCSGDFIALADQDDIWELHKISLMVQEIGSNVLLYHNSEFITAEGLSLGRKMTDVRNFYAGSDSRVFLLENCVSGHAILFKRELLTYFAAFTPVIFHDWWLVYMASNYGSVGFITDCLVKYRQHTQANTNILRMDRGQAKKDSLLQIEKEYERIQTFEVYPFNNFQDFKTRFSKLMKSRMQSYFSFSLAFFIFRHRKELLYIQKKSKFSKFNFILKYAWGYKLKKGLGEERKR